MENFENSRVFFTPATNNKVVHKNYKKFAEVNAAGALSRNRTKPIYKRGMYRPIAEGNHRTRKYDLFLSMRIRRRVHGERFVDELSVDERERG